MEDAYLITELPFVHDYSNAGYSRDYGTCCPYCYGPTPDVVYRFDPAEPVSVQINLCNEGTDYDTVVYFLRDTPNDYFACNDDACESPDFPYPYVSRIGSVNLEPGHSYYIVVGGYCGETGHYRLTVDARETHLLVSPDGSGAFATIQEALDASFDGDTIELADGVYTGPGNRALDVGYRSITLRSASGDPAACILDCEDAARGFFFHDWASPSTLIEGITIRRGSAPGGNGGGAYIGEYSGPRFRNCVFEQCKARFGAGVSIADGDPTFEDCRFRDNWASESGGAIHADSVNAPLEVTGCTLSGNKAALHGGAVFVEKSQFMARDCTLTDNRVVDPSARGGAVFADSLSFCNLQNTIFAFNQAPDTGGLYARSVFASCCDLYGNSHGDWGGSESQIGQSGNISLDPLFCDFAGEDFSLFPESPCAPNTPPNPECALIGAWPADCTTSAVRAGETDRLLRLWPNPARNGCTVVLPERMAGPATVRVFDPAGRSVRVLRTPAETERTAAIHWDERDDAGRVVPSGIYLIRVEAAGGSGAVRVTVLR